MAARLLALMATMLFAAACQAPWAQSACDRTHIDWVNFVQVGSTQYVAGPSNATTLKESDLGPVYAKVKFRVNENVCDLTYRPKDGDAAFLEAGTPIYQVAGRPPGELLAARFNGSIVVYRAMTPAS